ncbi:MAG: hypothetical protein Fues2KO_32340 [Fuerstiella sp.]
MYYHARRMNGDPDEPEAAEAEADSGPQWPAYYCDVRNFLQQHFADIWDWFLQDERTAAALKRTQQELNKHTVAVPADVAERLQPLTDRAADLLQLTVPVHLRQSVEQQFRSVHVVCLPREAHIIFGDALWSQLTDDQLLAVLLHEMAHFELSTAARQHFALVEEVVDALANDGNGHRAWLRTGRNLRLHAEFYCDRRAVELMDSDRPILGALLRLHSGVDQIDEDAFAKQVAELSDLQAGTTFGETHPELHLRARAMQWPLTDESQMQLRRLVDGHWELDQLDVLQQRQLQSLTSFLLDRFFRFEWTHSPALLGYAKRIDPDYSPPVAAKYVPQEDFVDSTSANCDVADSSADDRSRMLSYKSVQDYLTYVLLDLATIDPELEEAPLALANLVAEELRLTNFREVAESEIKVGRRLLRQIFEESARLVQETGLEPSR